MDQMTRQANKPDLKDVGDAAAAITTLARIHGVTAGAEPVDVFVEAASRLCDAEVDPDRIERLLVGLQRAGVVGDDEAFALHVVYLRQRSGLGAVAVTMQALPDDLVTGLRQSDAGSR